MSERKPNEYTNYDYYKHISTKLQDTLKTTFALITVLIALLALVSRSDSIDISPSALISNTFVLWGMVSTIVSIISNIIAQVWFKPPQPSKDVDEYIPAMSSLGSKSIILRSDIDSMDNYARFSIGLIATAAVLFLSGLFQAGARSAGYYAPDLAIWILLLSFIFAFVLLSYEGAELIPDVIANLIKFKDYSGLKFKKIRRDPSISYVDVEWMVVLDWRILHELEKEAQPEEPRSLKRRVGSNTDRIRNRCEILTDRGLLRKCDTYSYQITSKGSDFVNGYIVPEGL